jgi:hypothetical protein
MDELEKTIRDFEEKLSEAVREKYREQNGDLSPQNQELFLRSNSVLRFDILAFYEAYTQSDRPQEYIGKLVHALFDIKLQMFYIGEVDMGLYNTVLYSRGYNPDNPTPYASIKKLSLDQNVIVKSRILWERMINFASIYISGEEVKVSSGKSKKGKFAKLVEGTPWAFLKDYWKTLEWFDNTLRTPEVHSGSVLRKNLIHMDKEFDNSMLVLYNIAINLFYPNIMAITAGHEPPFKVWTLGMQEENQFPGINQ